MAGDSDVLSEWMAWTRRILIDQCQRTPEQADAWLAAGERECRRNNGGRPAYIQAQPPQRSKRDDQIRRAKKSGESIKQIAANFSLSPSAVYKICRDE